MNGMHVATGKPLSGRAHLAQSVADILATPIGSRVMRRDYGSALFELVDAPANPLGRLRIFAATVDALRRWEPRLRVTRVGLAAGDAPGAFAITIEGQDLEAPAPNRLVTITAPLRN